MTSRPHDLIVHARRIHTLQHRDQHEPITSLAITDGQVASSGTREEAESWAAAEVIDFGDAVIVPGLTDSHVHPILGIVMSAGVPLIAAQSAEQVAELLKDAASRLEPGDWLQAWGLDPNLYGGVEKIRAEDIDPTNNRHPMLIRFFDAHAALANEQALRIAGITGPRSFQSAAHIGLNSDGAPNGLLYEFPAIDLVYNRIPEVPLRSRAESLLQLLNQMAQSGLTGAHVMDAQDRALEVLAVAEQIADLPLRLRVHPWCQPGVTPEGLNELADMQRLQGRRWEVGGVKLFADGTVMNGTAWLRTPDTHGESTTSYWVDPAEFAEAIAWFDARGINTATHAIGDAGVEFTLDAIAATQRKAHHRLEHVDTMPDELIERFAQLGVAASMMPSHTSHFARADESDAWSQRLGHERASRVCRTRSFREAGVIVALGSDWPVAAFDPRPILADAQLRRRFDRPDDDPIKPGEALTSRMALEGYTTHAAAAAGIGNRAGQLAPGYQADMTVLAQDPMQIQPEELARTRVLATLLDGRIQFDGR